MHVFFRYIVSQKSATVLMKDGWPPHHHCPPEVTWVGDLQLLVCDIVGIFTCNNQIEDDLVAHPQEKAKGTFSKTAHAASQLSIELLHACVFERFEMV